MSLTDRTRGPTVVVMNTYAALTILVTAGTAVVGLIDYMRSGGALTQLGRQGSLWFSHAEDLPVEQQPSEDQLDAPIPRRPLRGRVD